MRTRYPALVVAALMLASLLPVMPASGGAGDGDRWGPGFQSDHQYIVVAPEGWRTQLQPLMDWRTRTTTYNIVFVPLEEALANGVGADRAARIKDYIRAQRVGNEGFDNALLLVGDSEVIPVRYVFTDILQDGNTSDPLNLRWTDDYYAYGSEKNWDRDGDGTYGEDNEVLDVIAERYQTYSNERWLVGRIPASTELEVERFVDKLLAYERTPPPGDWYTSALLASGLMDVPNHLDDPYTTDIDGGYELFSDNALESHIKLQRIIPERFDRTWLYDYPYLEGGHWNRSIDTLDHGSLVEAFDEGHSVVTMNGHGWVDGSGLAHYNGSGYSNYWWDWSDAYTWEDADRAANDGRLPWVYVAACYVGDVTVTDDRTLERLVMNPDGGAVGLVAGNGENYKGESMANDSYGNWFLERHFWSDYFQQGPGEAMRLTKQAYLALVSGDGVPHPPLYDAYYVADYLSPNLLGDPLTAVWTDQPRQLGTTTVTDIFGTFDGIDITVTDDQGQPVPDALVYIGWGGNHSTQETTDAQGRMNATIPLDAGELEIVVSARNHIPAMARIDRPVIVPDLEAEGITWRTASGGEGQPPLKDEEVTLLATVAVHGRYDYDQARLRFSVAPEGGDLERLVPDVFVPIRTGTRPVAERTWTPPWPGKWRVHVDVNPAGEVDERTISNNMAEATMSVLGPPRWDTLPASITVACGSSPAGTYDLAVHISDPDTPLEDLTITARSRGQMPAGTTFRVEDAGRLVVCTSASIATLDLELDVTDGAYTDTTELLVKVTRTPPRLRVAGETLHTVQQGAILNGSLRIEDLGPGTPDEGLAIVELTGNQLFAVEPDGDFTFQASVPGTYTVRVGIQRADGSSDPSWEGALLMFHVVPGAGLAPQPYGWPDLRVAGGQKVTVQLQAVDLEGGPVSYSVVDGDGLGATIDPVTGMLTLRPSEDEGGGHQVVVQLSDGTTSEEFTLQVYVTDPPSGSSSLWAMAGIIIAAAVVGLLLWFLVLRRRGDEDE